jgi:hypothetical protein
VGVAQVRPEAHQGKKSVDALHRTLNLYCEGSES